jgi:hypothetical protein
VAVIRCIGGEDEEFGVQSLPAMVAAAEQPSEICLAFLDDDTPADGELAEYARISFPAGAANEVDVLSSDDENSDDETSAELPPAESPQGASAEPPMTAQRASRESRAGRRATKGPAAFESAGAASTKKGAPKRSRH